MAEKDLPVIDVTLDASLESIPDEEPCGFCGGWTKRVLIEHLARGRDAVVRSLIPGYRCLSACSLEFLSPEGVLEAITRSCEVFRGRGDLTTARNLQYAITASREALVKRAVAKAQPLKDSFCLSEVPSEEWQNN